MPDYDSNDKSGNVYDENALSARALFSTVLASVPMLSETQRSGTILVKADGTINLDSYTCTGDIDKLTTPWQNAVDGNWNTKIAWNSLLLGDFSVVITENYSLQDPAMNVSWRFKAYHRNNGSLIPTPMKIECWNGSSWISIYELDDQEHVNEEFTETINIPRVLTSHIMTIKTTIMYSSHVVGGILPNPPEQLFHYVEYFEGELKESAIPEFPSFLFLLLLMVVALFATIVYKRKHTT